ncbi:MAG: hypothetical protein ABI465_07325 [Ktedonobacteraceae bacterium]
MTELPLVILSAAKNLWPISGESPGIVIKVVPLLEIASGSFLGLTFSVCSTTEKAACGNDFHLTTNGLFERES